MTIDRAIEILNPEHRENYDGMDEVNEACRMGMEALERTRWIPFRERLPDVNDADGGKKKEERQCLPGTVVWVHPRGRFYVVKFDCGFCEAFS